MYYKTLKEVSPMKFMKALYLLLLVAIFLTTPAHAINQALLIENVLPWDYNSNSDTLTAIGISFDKIGSANLAATDLTPYKFVAFASVQDQAFYNDIAANFAQINNYVLGGGVLIAHSALWGWPANGEWSPPNFLPGGVGRAEELSNSVRVVDPSSQIISGPYGTLTEANFQAWNYSTHGYFTDLVPGTHTIIDLNDVNKPVYIEYAWGSGLVRATMMTVEWGQNDASNTRYIFRENEYYGAANPRPSVPEPGTLLLLGAGLAFMGGMRLKRKS
jgi:hypothetical protein